MGRQNTVRQVSRQANRQSRQHATQQRTAFQQRATSDQNSADQRRKIFPSKLNPSPQDELKRLLFAARLIQRHPWLLWIVALSILVGSATAAITTILNPDASIPYSPGIAVASSPPVSSPIETDRLEGLPAPTPTPPASPISSADSGADSRSLPQPLRQQSHQPSQPSPSTASPRSAVGAIALSCAAGCFLLSQWLKPRPARRRVLFESQPSSKRVQHSTGQVQAANPSAEAVTPIASLELLQLPAARSISFDLNPAVSQSHETPLAETAEVTVLPAEQSHPLDWDEPSLADSLDLRQRRPLSYWL